VRIIIDIPDKLVREIISSTMECYPEAGHGNTMQCLKFDYEKLYFHFEDTDTGKRYRVTENMLTDAFRLLFTDKWPAGCVHPPANGDEKMWDIWMGECDVVSHDAFLQLAIFGEVIYG